MATVYISEYSVSREYGGPEEGGWWYDWNHFVRVVESFEADVSRGVSGLPYNHPAYVRCRALNDGTDNRDAYGRDRFCVNGGADVSYMVEAEPREWETTERPYYC